MQQALQLPVPVIELVPHRPPMLWLRELVDFSEDSGRAVGTVPADHILADGDGNLHPSASIELMAQAAAAHEGYRRRMKGQAIGCGFLVGVRDFTIRRSPRCGEDVFVEAERRWDVGPMHVTHGAVLTSNELLAEGELTFFVDDELIPPQLRRAAVTEAPAAQWSSGMSYPPNAVAALAEQWHPPALDAEHARFLFGASFPAFRGHFPGFPVLPAVVEVLAATEVARRRMPGGALASVTRAKFSQAILPGTLVTVECTEGEAQGAAEWRVRLLVDGAVAASILLGFASSKPGS